MRILGVDLGASRVKAVEIDSSFGRYEIHEYYDLPVTEGQSSTGVVRKLIDDLKKYPEKVIISLPSKQVTFRSLEVPTRDKKAIRSAVRFELEDELPFPSDEIIYDFSILSSVNKKSLVHISATSKKHIDAFLDELVLSEVEPDVITTDTWAYRSILNQSLAKNKKDKPVLLIDIGYKSTALYVHIDGRPLLNRRVPWGGFYITQAIQNNYGISFDEAEKVKKDNGFILPLGGEKNYKQEQIDFSNVLTSSMKNLIKEIKSVELSTRNKAHKGFSSILVTGDTSLMPGFIHRVAQEMQTSTSLARPLTVLSGSGAKYSDDSEASFLLSLGLAVSIVGKEKSRVINFSKGRTKKEKSKIFNKIKQHKAIFQSLSIVLLCFIFSSFVKSGIYEDKVNKADVKLEKSMKSFFGHLSESAVRTYLSSPEKLKRTIRTEVDKQKLIASFLGQNPNSPVSFLNKVSKVIPRSVVLDLVEYKIGVGASKSFNNKEKRKAELIFHLDDNSSAAKVRSGLTTLMLQLKQSQLTEVDGLDGKKRMKVSFTGFLKENGNVN